MRILLLHPGDDPGHDAFPRGHWDLVIDLGIAGQSSYRRWSAFLGCPVEPLEKLDAADFRAIRTLLAHGFGSMIDRFGLDWYDLISTSFYQQIEQAFRIQRLIAGLPAHAEFAITRPGFESNVIEALTGKPVSCLFPRDGPRQRIRHYAHELRRLPLAQLVQILGDKFDAGYRLRRLVSPQVTPCVRPAVLLPSSYINASRTALQYAELLPQTDFLLITTRQSGSVKQLPPSVQHRKLASYARGDFVKRELVELLDRFEELKAKLERLSRLSMVIQREIEEAFPKFLSDGLMLRDAWQAVFEREPISAVLCADDANHATRIPLLLGRERGLPVLSCHHGALDGRYRMRPNHDCLFLAKGRMEENYLHEVCGSAKEWIELGGPGVAPAVRRGKEEGKKVVFFSENYEAFGGRAAEIYRDVLPPLAEIALKTGRELVIKLHPTEILRSRQRMARSALSGVQFASVKLMHGKLSEELLNDTWFGVTAISTTAVDCSRRGIPIFLCPWLDYTNYAYAEQMLKFGVGYRLDHPEDVAGIPDRLKNLERSRAAELWQPMRPDRLADLLNKKVEFSQQGALAAS